MKLYCPDGLPEGLLERPARELHTLLPGPTLLRLPGRRNPALFVSVLLHGNEDVGWEAVRSLLRERQGKGLPRELLLFIGNVEAAGLGLRALPGGPDFNRIWHGGDTPEARMAGDLVARMRQRGLFASVDIHNNTGLNPHYACINRVETRFLHLATLFSRTVVYFLRPESVQSMAFATFCPAVTLECGRVGDRAGVGHARDYLEACLRLSALPTGPLAAHDLDLFHTVAVVRVRPGVDFGFDCPRCTLDLDPEIERYNFREIAPGTILGRVRGSEPPIEVRDEAGLDVTGRYFTHEGERLLTRRAVVPAMLTLDEKVIRQDCLCYLMERYPLPAGKGSGEQACLSAAGTREA